MTQAVQSYWTVLHDQQYMNVITFRRSGEAVTMPVWFVQDGERLYVSTATKSSKVRRIRNNGRVEVGPSDRAGKPLGATVPARARVVPISDNKGVDALLNKKYGLPKRAFDVMMTLRKTERVYLDITPAHEHEHLGDFAAAGT